MPKFVILATAVLAGLLQACNPVDAALDCHAICARYADCYNAQYDVGACESRCRGHSADDTDYRHKANQCEACINDRACTLATFNCGVECSSVVP